MGKYITFVVKGMNISHRALIGAELINVTKDCLVFRTGYDMLSEIADWFAEVPEIIPGYGYPNGTCLIYSIHEDGTVN